MQLIPLHLFLRNYKSHQFQNQIYENMCYGNYQDMLKNENSEDLSWGEIKHRLSDSDMHAWGIICSLIASGLVCSCLLFLFKWLLKPEENQQDAQMSYFLCPGCPTHS